MTQPQRFPDRAEYKSSTQQSVCDIHLSGIFLLISSQTLKSRRLTFQGFKGPFITHGIDVIDDPERPVGEAVYIFAVNHVPNSRHFELNDKQAPKSRSVIEVFHHVIGSEFAKHIRTVWHRLLSTPNDVLALSPTSFLVTNDHFYTEGHMRVVEDIYYGAKWSSTVHVTFSGSGTATHDADGVDASVALDSLHNNNGIGRGSRPDEVVVVTAASGTVNFGDLVTRDGRVGIHIKSTFAADSSLDNPSYFADPYANSTFDASGYIQCGLTRGGDLSKHIRDPAGKDGVMVWHMSDTVQGGEGRKMNDNPTWGARLLFEDDASRIRTCSAAVLVAIDPAKENGRRKAWLYVTGFLSKNMVAVKIDL